MSKSVGEYMLKDKIGKGSYADVYRGFHKTNGAKYAIKTIFRENLSDPKLLQGLESEIKIMREFNHENIVHLYEYFSSEKNFYLVLELCEGGDLSKYIKKKKRLTERVAHSFLLQLANGLAFLQERQFIHRDLKPANVLLTESSEDAVLKLADFGFARHLSVATLAQTRCGTPLYMAPEILESRDYDAKADIWSVGCILYEMLVGVYPFRGTNEADLLNNIKTKELSIPKDIEVSKYSIDVLVKLLERSPQRRATVDQLSAISTQLVKYSGGTARDAALFPDGTGFLGGAGEGKRSSSDEGRSAAATQMAASPPATLSPLAAAAASRQSSERNPINPSTATTMLMTKVAAYGGPVGPDGHMPRRYSEDMSGAAAPGVNASHINYRPEGDNSAKSQHQKAEIQQPQVGTPPQGSNMGAVAALGKAIAFVLSPQQTNTTPPESRVSSGRGYSLEEEKGRYMAQYAAHREGERSSSLPPTPKLMTPDSTSRGANNMFGSNYPGGNPSADAAARYRSSMSHTSAGSGGSSMPNTGYNSPHSTGSHHLHGSAGETGPRVTPTPGAASASASHSGLFQSSEEEGFVVIDQSYHEGSLARPPVYLDKAGNKIPTPTHQGAYKTANINRRASAPPQLQPFAEQRHPQAASLPTSATGPSTPGSTTTLSSAEQKMDNELEIYFAEVSDVHRLYHKAVHHITCLGDLYIPEAAAAAAAAAAGGSNSHALNIRKSTLVVCRLSLDDSIQLQQKQIPYKEPMALLDRYLLASTLYFHATSLLKTAMVNFQSTIAALTGTSPQNKEGFLAAMSVNHQVAYNVVKKELRMLYDQIIDRLEGCQQHIQALLQANAALALVVKFVEVTPAAILLHVAQSREEDGAIEELKNLAWAGKLYLSAMSLVDAILLTPPALQIEDREANERLKAYSSTLLQKYEVCRRRAEEVGDVWEV